MRTTINRKDLLDILTLTGKVIDTQAVLPARECYLIECKDSRLRVTTSNDSITLRATGDCESDDGTFLIRGGEFLKLIKEIKDEDIVIISDADNAIIEWGKGKASLPLINPSEYPATEEKPDNIPSAIFSRHLLEAAITHTVDYCANDELRPTISNLYLDFKKGEVAVVGTNGLRLCVCTVEDSHEAMDSFILDKKAASLIRDLKGDDVTISVGQRTIFIESGDVALSARKVEGQYPRYEVVFPPIDNCEATFLIDKSELADAVKRISICSDKMSQVARFDLSEEGCSVTAQDIGYSLLATEKLNATYQGQAMSIGLNITSLLDVVRTFTENDMVLHLTSPDRAILVEGDGSRIVLMPMII